MESTRFVDHRRSSRAREANPIRLAIASEDYGVGHAAITMNQSLQGVRIRTDVSLSPGEKILIFPQGGSQQRIPARVVWVREPEPGVGYVAGLEFLSLWAE
jgi:hypothetical protein